MQVLKMKIKKIKRFLEKKKKLEAWGHDGELASPVWRCIMWPLFIMYVIINLWVLGLYTNGEAHCVRASALPTENKYIS